VVTKLRWLPKSLVWVVKQAETAEQVAEVLADMESLLCERGEQYKVVDLR
jgi:hypothetical protein